MRVKVDIGSITIKYEDGNIHSVEPTIKADIDISESEIKFIRENDAGLWGSVKSMLTHTCSEIARQVQVS